MLQVVASVARLAVGLLLTNSAIAKLRARAAFFSAVAGYSLVPVRLARSIAFAVLLVEAVTGGSLLAGLDPFVVCSAAACLLVLFGLAVSWELAHGRRIECGCMGAGSGEISWRIPIRNVLIAAVMVASAVAAGNIAAASFFVFPSRALVAEFLAAAALLATYAIGVGYRALLLRARALERIRKELLLP